MKSVRTSAPTPKARPIMKFSQPAPAPSPAHEKPRASNAIAEHAVKVASSPGGINPKQQVF
jgi:hypothetical protein